MGFGRIWQISKASYDPNGAQERLERLYALLGSESQDRFREILSKAVLDPKKHTMNEKLHRCQHIQKEQEHHDGTSGTHPDGWATKANQVSQTKEYMKVSKKRSERFHSCSYLSKTTFQVAINRWLEGF